jgi:hypothetical protein
LEKKIVIQKNNLLAAGMAVLAMLVAGKVRAISLDDIQLWAGSGTNRAALVIEWSVPRSLTNSSVPVPVADKTLVWGYRFNGTATGTEMLDAVVMADPKLYVVENNSSGTSVEGIGYNLNANGDIGITDGHSTNYLANSILTNATVDIDSAYAINGGDLYWGGLNGPKWESWTELGDEGGFLSSPNRGTNAYWTVTDTTNYTAGYQGQWQYTRTNLNNLVLMNGSWIGFSVAAGEYESATNAAYNLDKHAPVSPDGTYVAYVPSNNDFAVQVVSANGISTSPPNDQPGSVLGAPTLCFYDPFDGDVTDRVSIIDPPFNVTPGGNDVITVINTGGELTVQMGHKIYANTSHPYGVDFIVYGNSFFDGLSGPLGGGFINDKTDLSAVILTDNASFGHQAVIAVSQDGANWVTLTNEPVVYPDEAYRWDDTNSAWTDERMNPTKPLNPSIYASNFDGPTVAGVLDQFVGAAGGSGFSLRGTGLPWIQYVQIETATDDYAVIDAIAAVNPVVVGDALSITPYDVAAGMGNLYFQNAANCGQNQIAIGFNSVSGPARISTVSLSDLSPFAPVEGAVSSAYQLQSRSLGSSAVTFSASVGLEAGTNYTGNGNDLRVFEWNSTNWTSQPFTYSQTNNEVTVAGVTNFSAFVVSQIVPPSLGIETLANGYAFRFTPVPNCPETLLRSTNLLTWTPIYSFTTTNAETLTLLDTNAPSSRAFYRLELNP